MTTIVKLVQGSPEWYEHRRRYRNASETPVVLGVSPWLTPYQLWQQKLGLTEPEITPPMLRGQELEPAARAAYEARTGYVMQPLVLLDGEYSASLDGVTLGGERIVEIKCPFRGRDSALWQAVEGGGHLPEHYQWQVQHQLMVAKAEIADVFIFDGIDGILLEVAPDQTSWPRICSAWQQFAGYVASQQSPPLTERDVRQRNDAEWVEAARAYIEARRTAEVTQRRLDDAKGRLIALTSHSSESGAGVGVTRYWRKGSIDYKRVPELADLDLEPFRGALREETRITII